LFDEIDTVVSNGFVVSNVTFTTFDAADVFVPSFAVAVKA